MRHRISMLILLGALCPVRSEAQVAALVYDPANWTANVANLLQTILVVANQVTELTGLGEIVLDGGFGDDMDAIGAVASDAAAVMGDVRSLQAQITVLFDVTTLPTTPRELNTRYVSMMGAIRDARLYAVRTQSLVTTVQRTVGHIQQLASSIQGLLGNHQANQSLLQVQSTSSQVLATLQLQNASYQRADSLDKMMEDVLRSSLLEMRAHFLDGWPGLEGALAEGAQ
jgi:conjugal transfer/entry exclusion protein